MKKTAFKLMSIAAFAVMSLSSCKKDDAGGNGGLVGTWTLSEVGADANSNGSVDNGETVAAALANVSGTTTFKSDNTYTATLTIMGDAETASGTYSYSNNQLSLTTGGDTDVISVKTLSNNRLVLLADTQWLIYTK